MEIKHKYRPTWLMTTYILFAIHVNTGPQNKHRAMYLGA